MEGKPPIPRFNLALASAALRHRSSTLSRGAFGGSSIPRRLLSAFRVPHTRLAQRRLLRLRTRSLLRAHLDRRPLAVLRGGHSDGGTLRRVQVRLLPVLETHGDHEYYVTAVSFYWTVLRCCSFCLDTIRQTADGGAPARGKRNHEATYFKTLAYAVYLPTLFLGPVQNYSDFASSMEKPKPSLTVREIGTLTAGLLRSGVHFLLMDLLCHYFYRTGRDEPGGIGRHTERDVLHEVSHTVRRLRRLCQDRRPHPSSASKMHREGAPLFAFLEVF